jgi:hypothetical protein
MRRVLAALLAMGFQIVLDESPFVTYLRLDTDNGVCVVIIDTREDEVWEENLVRTLDYYGVSLAEFWNLYDTTGED